MNKEIVYIDDYLWSRKMLRKLFMHVPRSCRKDTDDVFLMKLQDCHNLKVGGNKRRLCSLDLADRSDGRASLAR